MHIARQHDVVRYLQPGESAWKEMWDSFILEDAAGNERYPEGRSILLHKLECGIEGENTE